MWKLYTEYCLPKRRNQLELIRDTYSTLPNVRITSEIHELSGSGGLIGFTCEIFDPSLTHVKNFQWWYDLVDSDQSRRNVQGDDQ